MIDLDRFWPPGQEDAQIARLADAYIDSDNRLDLAGLLAEDSVGRIALVSSFGAESAALLHLVLGVCPDIDVLFLDTGKHFSETLAYRDRLTEALGIRNLVTVRPDPRIVSSEDPQGMLHGRDPDMCCMIRKTFPLQDALGNYDCWITGRKRYQGKSRSNIPYLERDGKHLKINPMMSWDAAAIEAYFVRHDLPRHPLQARGFPSIGCAPCTRAVAPGEDPRAGRWAGMDKVECGIHLGPGGGFVRNRRH